MNENKSCQQQCGVVWEEGATGEQRQSKIEWLSLCDSRCRGKRGTVKLESDGEGNEGRASENDEGD